MIDRLYIYKTLGLLGFAPSFLLILAIITLTFSIGNHTNTPSPSVAKLEWK